MTKKCIWIEGNISSMSEEDINEHLSILEDLKEKLDDANNKVLNDVWSKLGPEDDGDVKVAEEMDTWDDYNDRLSKFLSKLKSKSPFSPGSFLNRPHSEVSQLKLPELPLPSFSNKEGEDISKFFREFESTISK